MVLSFFDDAGKQTYKAILTCDVYESIEDCGIRTSAEHLTKLPFFCLKLQ